MRAFCPVLPLHGGPVRPDLKRFYYAMLNNVQGSHSPALPCEWAMVMPFLGHHRANEPAAGRTRLAPLRHLKGPLPGVYVL